MAVNEYDTIIVGAIIMAWLLLRILDAPGYADYRTPIRGLYNASSGTHGGGGVNGIPGLQAFRQAKRDRGIRG